MYQKQFPANLDYLYEMLDFIKNYDHKMPSSHLDQVLLAAEEALVNIIHYGYALEQIGYIEITCDHSSRGFKMTIKDQGVPFNPIEKISSLPSFFPATKTCSSLGGYGIKLLLKLMDEVEYQRINNENVLSLTKYIS
jgi:serine/threonine-protein kinase RsbW